MITVTGSLADAYQQYRDLRDDLMESIRTYRDVVAKNPAKVDAATVAACLSGQVRFAAAANAVYLRYLDERRAATAASPGELPSLAELRSGIEAKPAGRAVIEACAQAQCDAMLAEALAFCFIETHPRLIEVDTGRAHLESEDNEDGDEGTPPHEPPEGWGGM